MMFGSSLITLNAKLIGLQHSFFFYVCILGYSLAPMLIPALVNVLAGAIIGRLGVFIVAMVAYLWAVRSVAVFFSLTLSPDRKYMALYPVILYYLFFVAFIVLV
jgi:hypothetical protein